MFNAIEDVLLESQRMNDNLLLAAIALFIAWIWVDYFRLIDVFDRNSLLRVIIVFFIGAATVIPVVITGDYMLTPLGLGLNGDFGNDLFFCFAGIGLPEEIMKIVPMGIAFLLFRNHVREPLDVISVSVVGALGFSAAENFRYFTTYGAEIISARAILSTVGHAIFTAIFAYGFVLAIYRNRKYPLLSVLGYLLLAAFIHGLFDFFLMHKGFEGYGWILTLLLFMAGISLFATILNNALNISPFFSYKKSIDSATVTARMFLYYFLLFLTQCAIVTMKKDFSTTVKMVINNSYSITPVIAITALRLSRFKLIAGKWNELKFELPFSIVFGEHNGSTTFIGFHIVIKGEPFSDYHLNKMIGEYISVCPVSPKPGYLGKCRFALIRDKIFLNGEQAFFVADIFTDGKSGKHETVLLQAKSHGKTMFDDDPIVAIREGNLNEVNPSDNTLKTAFLEWAVLRVDTAQ
jgi:RsiW-degrading membrane proteinase PrsW (M82 family)